MIVPFGLHLRRLGDRARAAVARRPSSRRGDSRPTPPQRHALAAVAAVAVASSLAVIGSTTDLVFGGFSVGVIVLAVVAARQPDTFVPAVVITLVVLRWLVSDGSPTSAAVPAIAVSLALFHAVVALLASTPSRATVPRVLLRRWARRWLVVAAGTVLAWAVVLVLDRREAGSSSPATVASLVAVVTGLLLVRRRAVAPPSAVADASARGGARRRPGMR